MRRSIVKVGVLNIIMAPPHSPQRYIELLKKAFALKNIISLRADYQGMLGSCQSDSSLGQEILTGTIYKFINIDIKGRWFNINESRPAAPTDLNEVHVPDHLKPNLSIFHYLFNPNNHKIIFINKFKNSTLPHNMVKKLFYELLNKEELIAEYGFIDIIIEPQRETLQTILEMPILKTLYIEVIPPNPDFPDEEEEEEIFRRLTGQRAIKMTTELTSGKDGLAPDDITKKIARVAQSNGKVRGHGFNLEGKALNESTTDHPFIYIMEVPSHQSISDTLKERLTDIFNILKRK